MSTDLAPRIVLESREPPEIVLDPDRVPEIPEEALALEAQLEEGSRLYNGHTYRLLGWSAEPFRLTLGVTRYFHWLAVKSLARAGGGRACLPDGQPDPLWSHGLGVNVLAVTRDGLCVVTRRSERVAVHPNEWTASAGETLEVDSTPIVPEEMVRESLRREVGTSSLAGVVGWALILAEDELAWAIGVVAEIGDSWKELRSKIPFAAESLEMSGWAAVRPEELPEFTRQEPWVPATAVLARWASQLLLPERHGLCARGGG